MSRCHPAVRAFLKRRFHRSELAVLISIFPCAIVPSVKRAGAPAPPRTSAAPDCCSRRRNCSFRMHYWRLASCCRRKLPALRPPKSSVAEKWSAPSKRKDKAKAKDEVWPPPWLQRFSNTTSSTAPTSGKHKLLVWGRPPSPVQGCVGTAALAGVPRPRGFRGLGWSAVQPSEARLNPVHAGRTPASYQGIASAMPKVLRN